MEIYKILEIVIGVLIGVIGAHYLIKLEEWIPSYVVKYYNLYRKKQKHSKNQRRTAQEIQRAVLYKK